MLDLSDVSRKALLNTSDNEVKIFDCCLSKPDFLRDEVQLPFCQLQIYVGYQQLVPTGIIVIRPVASFHKMYSRSCAFDFSY
jgi:hypothetical protein